MIKNDFRYIIKKILIGIGIILGISFIRSCKVSALNIENQFYNLKTVSSSYNPTYSTNNSYNFYFNRILYNINYRSNGLYINDIFVSNNYFNNNQWYIGLNSNNNVVFYYLLADSGSVTFSNSWRVDSSYSNFPIKVRHLGGDYSYWKYKMYEFDSSGNLINTPTETSLSACSYASGVYSFVCDTDYYIYGTNKRLRLFRNTSNTNIDTYISSDFSSVNTEEVSEPEIVSLNAQLNKTDDNMLVSVSFAPEFSFIDTENYNYYAWFEGEQKYNLTENNVSFNTQSNTTFYVEITDKQGNSIDTETYTVSSIGLVYNGSYDIQFKTDEYSQSDTENNTDQIFDVINRIDIEILYIPKWVNYKYQYQYVTQNGSLTDNWVLVNDNNDKNNVVYSASLNGTMYARILDENDNVLKTETFTITRIGQLKTYDKNTDKFYGMFNIIKEKINFGGPISDLIIIPVNVLQSIFNASNKVCTPYDLGSIGGHHIVFPCIEPEHYLGSALWTLIDLIFSGCMFFAISKWFTSAYYNFILLDNTPGIKERRDLD